MASCPGTLLLLSTASALLGGTASAMVPGPTSQISSGPGDKLDPAISGDRVVWTQDVGPPNDYDIFFMTLGNPQSTNITAKPGGQFFDDIDGRWAVYVDDSSGRQLVVVHDLLLGSPFVLDLGDGVNCAKPDVYQDASGPRTAFVHRDGNSDIVFVDSDLTTVRFPNLRIPGVVAPDPVVDDAPRIMGDIIVWQRQDGGTGQHHIYAYRISTDTAWAVTSGVGNDDTSPDVDGNTIVFTRNGVSIFAVPVTGGALTPVSVGAAGTRDRARISGNLVVWDDHRAGDCDVWFNTTTGGAERLLVGGAGDQFLTDLDGSRVVYTAGPVGGPHDIFLLSVVGCMVDADCGTGQLCDVQTHSCVAKAPQCVTSAGCQGGQVCVAGSCVACTSDGQCGAGKVCTAGACSPKNSCGGDDGDDESCGEDDEKQHHHHGDHESSRGAMRERSDG